MIPQATKDSLDRYVNEGIMPGSFLRAVLTNDLASAVFKADSKNLAALKDIMLYIYNEVPANAWGSTSTVVDYAQRKFKQVA
jgi:hypothetical protein